MKKLKFGFTGVSDRLQQTSVKVGQWWYIVAAILGSAAFGVSTAFVGNYNFSDQWDVAQGFKACSKALICNPWVSIVCSIGVMLYGGKGTYMDLETLKLENDELNKENLEVV